MSKVMEFYALTTSSYSKNLLKILLVVKLIIVLLVTTIQTSSAASYYSQTVSLKLKHAKLETVLKEISTQAGFDLVYTTPVISDSHPVDINVNNASIYEALDECLTGQDLTYTISNKTVIVKRKADSSTFNLNKNATLPAEIKGQVTDANGESLPGVSIKVKGTTTGATTDMDGRYSISVPDGSTVLVFTYIGYVTQEVSISGRTALNVKLEAANTALSEVVVTAFGISREKKALAYSVTEVKGEDLTQAREVNVANALSGKVAGVNVSGNATGPGGSSRVIIRGNGSLAGNNQPLYVVNGMPMDNSIPGGGTASSGGGVNVDRGDGIAGINPDDIETISVLKGGPAAALYGSRASNGVILITTKKGKSINGVGVDFNSTSSFETIALYPDWQYEYGQGIDGVKPTTAVSARSSGRLSFGAKMDGSPVIQLDGVVRPYSPIYVKDNIDNFYRTGSTYTNTVAFTGGSQGINFRFSVSNMDANAILEKSSINRKTANLNVNALLGKRLSVEAVGQYNLEAGENRPKVGYADHNTSWATYLIANTMDIRTLSPGYDANFNEMLWNASSAATNPYFVLNRYHNGDDKNRFLGQFNVKYDILKNLSVKASVSKDYYKFDATSVVPTGTAAEPKGSYENIQASVSETNSLVSLNYNTSFLKNFSLSAMAGGNQQESIYDQTRINGAEFTIPYFYSYTNVASLSTSPNYQQSKINSLFGSVDLDYKRVAFLTVSARKDWFSTLSPKNNNILYPSVGGSLIISEAVKLPTVISFLKLRASWAQVGGATPSPYSLNQSFSMVQGGHNGRPVQGLSSRLVTNPDLKPLTSTTYEAGMDVQFFNNRLGMDLTLYNRKTTDDIVRTTISNTSGYTEALLNVGEVSNKGIELMFTGRPIKVRNFTWDVNYNLAYNKSEIVKLAEGLDAVVVGTGVSGGVIQNVVGRPFGTVWGFNYKKNAQGQTIYNATSNLEVSSNLEELGVGVPPLTMGLTNTFGYKNFSLNVLLDGKFGNTVWSNTNWYASRFGLPKWTLAGRESGLPLKGVNEAGAPYSYTVPVAQIDNYYNSQQTYTGLFAYDGSFVKLRQVIVGYKLPVSKLGALKIQSATISAVGRNLAILYKKTENFDPESSNTSDNAQGLEAFGLPRTRSFGVNLQVKF
jgi:TonB-linked SusC/RagA family outer membrane protein